MVSDTSPLRLAFVGVTHPHAHAWATAVAEHEDAVIAAVFDPDPASAERFAATYHCPQLDRLDLHDHGLDAVVVDGRNDQAHSLSMAALEANLPIFIEKTGGMSAAELQKVADEAQRRGLPTQMGFFLRYSDAVESAANALSTGELGRLSLARFHAAIPEHAWVSMKAWFGDSSNVVGPFMEAGCHLIDIVRQLLGEPTSVTARASHWNQAPNHAEDALAATLLIGQVVVSIDFTAHEANPWNANWSIELYGSERTLRAGLTPSWTATNAGTYRWQQEPAAPSVTEEAHQQLAATENSLFMKRGMDAFVEALRGRRATPVDAASGARTLYLIEEIYQATRS